MWCAKFGFGRTHAYTLNIGTGKNSVITIDNYVLIINIMYAVGRVDWTLSKPVPILHLNQNKHYMVYGVRVQQYIGIELGQLPTYLGTYRLSIINSSSHC